MLDREKVAIDYLYEIAVGVSESVDILVAMITGMGETLHRSPKIQKSVGPIHSRTVRDTTKVCTKH